MPTDPIRLEAASLLASVQAARAAVSDALAQLAGTAGQAQLATLLRDLAGAEGEITLALQSGTRPSMDLAAIARLVKGTDTAITTAAATATASAANGAAADLASISAATRQTVRALNDDLYTRRIFDGFLTFGSEAEARAYRDREAERQRLIAEELARNTPEGNLNAAIYQAGQMADAGAHGATASPDFMPRWQRLVETIQTQRQTMRDNGEGAHADRLVHEQLDVALHHIPATDRDRILAANDPLHAATVYFQQHQGAPPRATERPLTPPAQSVVTASAIMATVTRDAAVDLASLGLSLEDAPSAGNGIDHGLPERRSTAPSRASQRG